MASLARFCVARLGLLGEGLVRDENGEFCTPFGYGRLLKTNVSFACWIGHSIASYYDIADEKKKTKRLSPTYSS